MKSSGWLVALLCVVAVPAIAQYTEPTVPNLRSSSYGGSGVTITLQGWNAANDGGGGVLYSDSTAGTCTTSGNGTISGSNLSLITGIYGPFNWSDVALNTLINSTGFGITNDRVVAFNAASGTITLSVAAASSGSGVSFSANGDNGGTSFVSTTSYCFHRVSQTYSQFEWGTYGDCCGIHAHPDTFPLQNWINAPQSHIAVPGNFEITAPLTCEGAIGSFSGPPRSGVNETGIELPLFMITANNSSGAFTGNAMLEMDNTAGATGGCAIHNVGLIADGSGNFDTVDAYGQADLVDGSFLYGGNVNFHCMGAGEDVQLFDSFVTSSVNDDIDSNCPDFRVERNVIAQAGSGANNSAVGIHYTNTDAIIVDNTIELSTGDGVDLDGAQLVRFANNFLDRNGYVTPGSVGLRLNNSNFVTACDNVFSLSAGASVGAVPPPYASHIYLSGAVDSLKLCGNVYYTDATNGQVVFHPSYDYDAKLVGSQLTNIDISENAAPADLGVFSPSAIALGLQAAVTPHVWQNYANGFALADASTGGVPILDIAPGDAPDSTNSFPITLTSSSPTAPACIVNFGLARGLGALDAGTLGGNTKYYIYAVSGPEGHKPNCMASLNAPSSPFAGPSFVNASGYTTVTAANTFLGSPTLFNVGQSTSGLHSSQSDGWPLKGAAIGNLIKDSLGYLPPAGTTVSGLSSYNTSISTCMLTSYAGPPPATLVSCTLGPPALVMGMVASAPDFTTSRGNGNAAVIVAVNGAQYPPSAAVCTSTATAFCVNVASSATGPESVNIGGNLTITAGASAGGSTMITVSGSSVTTVQDAITIYTGYYRLLGTVITNSGATDFSGYTSVQNLTGLTASITNPGAGACTSGTATVPGAMTGIGQKAVATPVLPQGVGIVWSAAVTAANTVRVNVCAVTAAIGSTAYNVTVLN